MDQLPQKAHADATELARQLPSGRTVHVHSADGREEIEIRSPGGEMEVRIALTPQGPVLQLRGARLEIDSTDTVAVNCRSFEINAADAVKIQTAGDVDVAGAGELRMKMSGQAWIDGDYVNLNCRERAGYHDDPAVAPPPLPDLPTPTADAAHDGSHQCGGH